MLTIPRCEACGDLEHGSVTDGRNCLLAHVRLLRAENEALRAEVAPIRRLRAEVAALRPAWPPDRKTA